MVIEIRQLKIHDCQHYLTLVKAAYASNVALAINFQASSLTILQAHQHLAGNAVYGLFCEQQLVSTLTIRFPWSLQPGPYRWPHLGWFATLPQMKRQGFGRQLFFWIEENILIDKLHCAAVSLGTAVQHPWLVILYQKYGFQVVEQVSLSSDHKTVFMLKTLIPELFQT